MRRRHALALFAMALALVLATPATAQTDPDWLDEDFESGVDVFNAGAWGMEGLSSGHVGSGLRSIIPDGGHWGSSGHWYFDDHGLTDPEALYWRYYLRFPEGFYINPPDRGKLPGPANLFTYNCLGGRVSTATDPCWSARMLFSRDYSNNETGNYQDGPSDRTLIGFYTYHLDGPADRGDILTWNEDVALLEHGPWYCIEGYIDLNTPGQNDGVLQGWVDGEEAFSRSDFQWRRSTEGHLDVKSFWFDVYYGGGASTRDVEVHFDSLALGSQRIGCDDSGSWDGRFSDDDGSIFEEDVEWLAEAGITLGCNPPSNDRFCPDDSVTRGQMAAFLGRALDLPASAGDRFVDDEGSIFEEDVNALAASGITAGCSATKYCPDAKVTRGQMAAFLHRALDGELPLGEPETFTDTVGSQFLADIDWLSATGVTAGCGTDIFCPGSPVTRAQMAAFLHRALG